MDVVSDSATLTKPSDDKEKRKSEQNNGEDLTPKTAWELVLNGGFFFGPFRGFTCGFALFGRHSFIIAQITRKRKRFRRG